MKVLGIPVVNVATISTLNQQKKTPSFFITLLMFVIFYKTVKFFYGNNEKDNEGENADSTGILKIYQQFLKISRR